jgi:hypothetical protein
MQEANNFSQFVPILIGGGACATLLTVSIVIFRALTLNTSELLLKITALVLAGSTLFFYCVIWLGATLLDPSGNHLTKVLLCYLFTGIIPSIFLYTKVDAPKNMNNITETERTNEDRT